MSATPDLPPADPSLVEFAVELVRDAGNATLHWFQARDLVVDAKADGTPVTAADRAAERMVRERIGERFPDDGVLGEEEPDSAGTSLRNSVMVRPLCSRCENATESASQCANRRWRSPIAVRSPR